MTAPVSLAAAIGCLALTLVACTGGGIGGLPRTGPPATAGAPAAEAAAGRAAAAKVSGSPLVGIAAGSGLTDLPAGQLADHLGTMTAAGAGWVRFDLWWSDVERRPGELDWRSSDRVVRAAREVGLRVILIPLHAPDWARPEGSPDTTPPTEPATYARFVAAAAGRYAPLGVHTWEIWNEPNSPDAWSLRPSPEAYARLLRASASAIRQADAGATVLVGGLAPGGDDRVAPEAFLAGVYRAGGRGSFDGVGLHPYGKRRFDRDAAVAVHQQMEAAGDADMPLWGTEFGVPTSDDEAGVSRECQAEVVAEALTSWRELPWAGPFLVYMHRDSGTDRDDPDDNFGLVDHGGSPKPAFEAFRKVAAGEPLARPTGEALPSC